MRKLHKSVTVRLVLGLLTPTFPLFAVAIISGNPNQAANFHTGTAGVVSYGQLFDSINLSGVVEVTSSIGGCSGTLLDNGTSILTAGHCVMSAGSTLATGVSVNFYGPSGFVSDPVASFQVDPGYNGSNSSSGADLAVITLSRPAPSFAVEYSLYTGSSPLATPLVIAGYGYGGTGANGANSSVYPYGTLRVGTNEYEGAGAIFGYSSNLLVAQFYEPGTGNCNTNPNTTDALCVTRPYSASDEVDITFGDSGGPTFFDGEIVGVHDLGICNTATSTSTSCLEPPSVGPANDSYFGEMFADTSVAANIGFIDEAANIPEPGTSTLSLCALAAAAALKLRKLRV